MRPKPIAHGGSRFEVGYEVGHPTRLEVDASLRHDGQSFTEKKVVLDDDRSATHVW